MADKGNSESNKFSLRCHIVNIASLNVPKTWLVLFWPEEKTKKPPQQRTHVGLEEVKLSGSISPVANIKVIGVTTKD